jgi:hypothetical protein
LIDVVLARFVIVLEALSLIDTNLEVDLERIMIERENETEKPVEDHRLALPILIDMSLVKMQAAL